MTDIVEFLTARLDEDEAGALATTPVPVPGRWKAARDKHADDDDPLYLVQGEDEYEPGSEDYDGNNPVIVYSADWQVEGAANLRHIARHDPARGLREVRAKRALMALHGLETLSHQPAQYELPEGFAGEFVGYCQLCSDLDYPEGLATYYEPWPCPSTRILATVYADHPDYKQEWSVE